MSASAMCTPVTLVLTLIAPYYIIGLFGCLTDSTNHYWFNGIGPTSVSVLYNIGINLIGAYPYMYLICKGTFAGVQFLKKRCSWRVCDCLVTVTRNTKTLLLLFAYLSFNLFCFHS